jgi:GT2 family glycosyltransferase
MGYPKVSTLIVTYNSERTIKNCLTSLYKNTKIDKVLVIDNNSTDGTTKTVRKYFPKIKIIKNRTNKGFAAAVNVGIKNSHGDVLLLNPDTLITDNMLQVLANTAYKSKSIACVAPKILNSDGTLQPNCGNFPTAGNIFLDRLAPFNGLTSKSELIRKASYYEQEQYPDWVSGTCMYIKREQFNKIGPFDKSYFMYLEEVDWCYRARKTGFKILYLPKAHAVHFSQGNSAIRKPTKFYNMRKGFLIFFTKHGMESNLLVYKIILRLEIYYKIMFGSKNVKWQQTYLKTLKLL